MKEYEAQAQAFLDKHRFTLKVVFGESRCPPWESGRCIHGDQYRVTLRRQDQQVPKSLSFDFWNSQADMQANRAPTPYGVLACISSEATAPTDPDDVAAEYGDGMKPSQCIAVAKFARRLQAFFRPDELEALAEIS